MAHSINSITKEEEEMKTEVAIALGLKAASMLKKWLSKRSKKRKKDEKKNQTTKKSKS